MEQDAKHKEALRLFQDGEYEQAIEAMAESGTVSDGEYKDFVGQCKMVLTDQYKYLIDEAISEGNSGKAKNLQEEFLRKFGHNNKIENLSITAVAERKMVECPVCAELIPDNVEMCPYCHEKTDGSTIKRTEPKPRMISCPVCAELIPDNVDVCPICNEKIR